MSKNIFEPRYDIATPIAGLTCKPLAILPETISPQEMSLARGGNDGKKKRRTPDMDSVPSMWDIITNIFGSPSDGPPEPPDWGTQGPSVSPADLLYRQGDPVHPDFDSDEEFDQNEVFAEADSMMNEYMYGYSWDDENGDDENGDDNNDDECDVCGLECCECDDEDFETAEPDNTAVGD